jgi:hypothetical protein
MAKINYSFQKAERERAKLAKKAAKKQEGARAATDKPSQPDETVPDKAQDAVPPDQTS